MIVVQRHKKESLLALLILNVISCIDIIIIDDVKDEQFRKIEP